MDIRIWIFVNDIYLNEYLTIAYVSLRNAIKLKYLKEIIGVNIHEKYEWEWKTTKLLWFTYNNDEYVVYCQIRKNV
jgi:hypothetical protein